MLRGIVRYYMTATGDLGRPPKNMDELKTVLVPLTKEPDKFVRSTRDGQEFVVAWDTRFDGLSPDTIVAYERTGVDGKRLVANLGGEVREVNQEEFAHLKFPKDHKPDIGVN